MKRSMKAGEVAAVAIVRNPPEKVGTMQVIDLLLAQPKIGRVKANRILKTHAISPSKTVAGLADRQRQVLIEALQR